MNDFTGLVATPIPWVLPTAIPRIPCADAVYDDSADGWESFCRLFAAYGGHGVPQVLTLFANPDDVRRKTPQGNVGVTK